MNRIIFYVLTSIALISCSGGSGEKANEEVITSVMKRDWEKPASNFSPASTVTINDIKLGDVVTANYANELEGIPKDATITNAKIDYTVSTHYDSGKDDVRRIMTAYVYKDKFKEWAVMNVGTTYPGN